MRFFVHARFVASPLRAGFAWGACLASLALSGAAAASPPASGSDSDWSVTPDGEMHFKPRLFAPAPDLGHEDDGEGATAPTGVAAAIESGVLLPMTLTPVVPERESHALVLAGFDGANRGALVDSQVEATVWGPIALRGGVGYAGATNQSLPFLGARVELLSQKSAPLGLGAGLFYRPNDFRAEGNIVASLSFSRQFDRLGTFASAAFESDPEGDDRAGDARGAALLRLDSALYAGVELRYRRDLASDDAKRTGHSEPLYDFRAMPLVSYALGPVALVAEGGFVASELLNEIGTPHENRETHTGTIVLGGVGGAL